MTRRQIRSLRRNVKMATVIGAMIYLAVGISTLGKSNELKPEPATDADTRTSTAMPSEEVIRLETETFKAKAAPTQEPVPETKYHSIIYSYDWDAEDSELLCKIAMAEAGNQDTEGKALVMLVVLNRVWGDNEFPNTIKDVIYQPRQFSPVLEGKFENAHPDEDCWEALRMVEMGWDESQGALYFESRSDSTWHQEHLKFLFQHGDHFFYTERD